MLYKVIKEEGVTVDNIEFAKGEYLELEPEDFNINQLLTEGSIVADDGDDDLPEEPTLPGEDEPLSPNEGTHQKEEGEA